MELRRYFKFVPVFRGLAPHGVGGPKRANGDVMGKLTLLIREKVGEYRFPVSSFDVSLLPHSWAVLVSKASGELYCIRGYT